MRMIGIGSIEQVYQKKSEPGAMKSQDPRESAIRKLFILSAEVISFGMRREDASTSLKR